MIKEWIAESNGYFSDIYRNIQTLVQFGEMTEEIDLFETAVAEYDGVIIQLLFPNPAAGYPKFQLLKTEIGLPDPTSYFKNAEG